MSEEVADQPVAETTSTELTVATRAEVALGSSKARVDLAELAAKSVNVTEIKDKAGRDEAHSFAMALVRARTTVSKIGKEARDDAVKFSKAIVQEEAALILLIQPEEKRLLALRDAWDAAETARKEAEAAKNRARIIAINERITGIKEYVALALECRTSTRIQALQDKIAAMDMTGFEEFEAEAQAAWKATGARVEQILTAKLADEAERERVKKEQEEAAAKLAAERAAFEAQQAAAKAAADLKQAEETAAAAREKAQRDADAAQLAAERAKFEAEQAAAKELLDAKERKLAADQAALDAQKAPQASANIEPEATNTVATTPLYVERQEVDVDLVIDHGTQRIEAQAPVSIARAAIKSIAQDPSDADIIWTAVNAVAQGYQLTKTEAVQRLAAIQDWPESI